jgi:hypothetical protein
VVAGAVGDDRCGDSTHLLVIEECVDTIDMEID